MKINQVNSNTQSFKALYATPETLEKIGCTEKQLLSNPMIKKCAEKYDVLVTAGDKKYWVDRHDGFKKDKLFPTAYLIGTVWSAPHIVEWLNYIGISDIRIAIGTCAALFGGAMLSLLKLVVQKVHTMKIQGAQYVGLHRNDYSYIVPQALQALGITSLEYETKINNNGTIEDIPDIAEKIEDREKEIFYQVCLYGVDLDDMYTPEKYLKNLKKIQKKATQQGIKDVFSYPVNKGGDTLLTMFFDVAIPTGNDSGNSFNDYYKIMEEISKTDKKNFDQKDSFGVSILEKIMHSENMYILPYINGVKFSYSPFLSNTYNRIKNEDFKEKLKSRIDFNFDLLENNNGNK